MIEVENPYLKVLMQEVAHLKIKVQKLENLIDSLLLEQEYDEDEDDD